MADLPHVSIGDNDAGQVLVTVEDTELFDFVEDVLTEDHHLEYLHVVETSGSPPSYIMTFPGDLRPRIEAALAALDPARLREIYLINNPERGA